MTIAVVALVATAGLAETHTVRSGETLGRIARRYGTTVDAIAAANGITNVNIITTGTVLVIPGAAPAAPAPAPSAPPAAPAAVTAGPVHTVRVGETLFKIAQRYDTTVDAIVAANAITDRRRIHAGQRFAIPVAAPTAPSVAPVGPATAPAPAAASAAPAAVPSGIVHTVRRGETLGRIARRYGTTVDAILAVNPVRNRNVIHVGDRFVIPVVAPAPAPGSSGADGVYVVRPGDTLAAVAARHGVSVEGLAAANGLSAPDTLIVGNRLFLTAQNGVPATALAACPVPGSSFANDFGYPRTDGRFHDGVDLFAPSGTPVIAPVSGRVQHLSGPIGGHQFILRGDDGHRYAGSHLSAFGTGGRVTAGTVIGFVGDTGNAVGVRPHLHFEIRPGGGPSVNPFSVMDAAC